MTPFDFIILGLAVFRLSLMVTKENGPLWVFKHLRELVKKKANGKSHMDEGIECLWCMSMQIALVVAILSTFLFHCSKVYDVIVYALALSGLAIILNQQFTKD